MPSIRSRLILTLIRYRHLLGFRFRRPVVDESFPVEDFRRRIDRVSARMRLPADVRREDANMDGIRGEWIIPENRDTGAVLFYIHGGGFISGSCDSHRVHVAKIARTCRMRALVFDYRLAPEHPYPAGLNDCLAAYRGLLHLGVEPEDIIVGGESAGGTLALALVLALKADGDRLPRAVFSISPLGDFRCRADSFVRNAGRDIALLNSWNIWGGWYVGDHEPADPLISPVYGDFRGLPPLLLCVGTHEVHYDDCRRLADVAEAAGVETVLSEWEGMVHAFPLLAPILPEATAALGDIARFISRCRHRAE